VGTLLAQGNTAAASKNAPPAVIDEKAEAEMVKLVNQERAAKGLPELMLDPRLRDTARFHSVYVQGAGQVGYEFPGEPKIHARMGMMNVLEDKAAENVSLAPDIQMAHQHMMSSDVMRDNVLSTTYNRIGIGVLRQGDKLFIVEDFARLLNEQSVEEVEKEVANALNEARRARKTTPLTYVEMASLRKTACDMAAKNKIDPNAAPVSMSNADIHGMNSAAVDARDSMATFTVTFTTFHPNEPPTSVLKDSFEPRYTVVSTGACFERTDSYPQGTYWVTVLLYHRANFR
jgi:uncharacterized protein YkwD